MKISTLSIGDELISGNVTDTNAGTIAALLLSKGVRVLQHRVVGDNEGDIVAALEALAAVSDALIITGGLGPTADDLTSVAAARGTGRRLMLNEEARAHVRMMSGKLQTLILSSLNDKQAMIPSSSSLIPNPTGTACGFQLVHDGCLMFFLPGVPTEMVVMLRETVLPFLLERIPRRCAIRSASFNVFGPCEAEVDELLLGIARPEAGLTMGICVEFPWMKVTLQAETEHEDEAAGLLELAVAAVRQRIGEYCFSTGNVSFDEAIAELLRAGSKTLSLAESCTGGLIAKRITDVAGSSRYFSEGVVTYSNGAKMRLLSVPADLLECHGAVSPECAAAMATGIRHASGSDIGIAVTGIAGPDGGSMDKPVGTVFIALADREGCRTKHFQFHGNRNEIRILTAWSALDWLRRYLQEQMQ